MTSEMIPLDMVAPMMVFTFQMSWTMANSDHAAPKKLNCTVVALTRMMMITSGTMLKQSQKIR